MVAHIKLLALVFLVVGTFATSATAAFSEAKCYGEFGGVGYTWSGDPYNGVYTGGGEWRLWSSGDRIRPPLTYVGAPEEAGYEDHKSDCHAQVCLDAAMDNQASWGRNGVTNVWQTQAFCEQTENVAACAAGNRYQKANYFRASEAWNPVKHTLYGITGGYDGAWKGCYAYGENNELPQARLAAGRLAAGTADLELMGVYEDDDDYQTQFACTTSCDSMVFEAVQGSTKIYVDAVVKADITSGAIAVGNEMRLSACTEKEETVVITGVGPITFDPALEFDHSLLPTFVVDLQFAVKFPTPTCEQTVSQVQGTVLDLDCATGSVQANLDEMTEAVYNATIAGGATAEDIISISTSATCSIPKVGGIDRQRRQENVFTFATEIIFAPSVANAIAEALVVAANGNAIDYSKVVFVNVGGEPVAVEIKTIKGESISVTAAELSDPNTNPLDLIPDLTLTPSLSPTTSPTTSPTVSPTTSPTTSPTKSPSAPVATPAAKVVVLTTAAAHHHHHHHKKGKKAKHGEADHMHGEAKKSKADKSSKKAKTTKKDGDGKKGKKGKSAKTAKDGKKGKRGKGDAAGLMATAGDKVAQNKIAFGSAAAVCILAVAAAFFATKQQRQPAQTTIVVQDETSPMLV